MAEIRIQGLADLKRALNDLPAKIEKNIMRGALRAGANEIKKAAQANVPVKSGALKNSIKVSTRARKDRYMRARVTAGDKTAFYAHMVEFGTAAHRIRPKGKKSLFFAGIARTAVEHPGAEQRPFMRPALDSASQAAVQATADYIRNRLAKERAK